MPALILPSPLAEDGHISNIHGEAAILAGELALLSREGGAAWLGTDDLTLPWEENVHVLPWSNGGPTCQGVHTCAIGSLRCFHCGDAPWRQRHLLLHSLLW